MLSLKNGHKNGRGWSEKLPSFIMTCTVPDKLVTHACITWMKY